MSIEANAPEIAAPPVLDNPNPDPSPAAPEPAPAPPVAEVEAPEVETSARDAIAARFRAKREAEAAQIEEGYLEEDELTAEPPPPPPPPEERYRVKVRGNEFMLNRDELIKTAGLRPEEADGIPIPALLRAAQINAAAEDYLAEAKTTYRTGRTAAPPAEGTPPPENADPEEEAPARRKGTPDPTLVAAAAKIQYGEPEEAAAAIEEILEAKLEMQRTADREQMFKEATEKAVKEFATVNGDLFADPISADLVYVAAMHEIKNDLIRLGANPDDVHQAVTDPTKAVEAYTTARQMGLGVRDPHEVLNTAATTVRQRLGKPAPSQQPSASPATRADLKRALPAQPRPATVAPASSQPAPQPRSPSSVVLGMRRARGQPV